MNSQEIDFEELIDGIFRSDPRDPYSIAIDFDQSSVKELFETFLRIFHRGSIILFGDDNDKVDLDKLTIDDFIYMGKYFKSFGIDIFFKKIPHHQYIDYISYISKSNHYYDSYKYEQPIETVDIVKFRNQKYQKIDDFRYQIIVKDNLYILYFRYGNYFS
jgi:hypothetical protein